MKQILTTAAICALCVGQAAAQDANYDWSGVYAGAQLGHGWGNAQVDYLNPSVFGTAHEPEGFLGGVYVGYTLHLPSNLVIGFDADIAWWGANTNLKPLLPSTADFGAVGIDHSIGLRARLGFAADRFLPFIAGGVAISRADFTYDMSSEDAVISSALTGWTLGAGLEYAATDNLILRAEYRYSDFGEGTENAFQSFPTHQSRYDLKIQEIRFGLSYKF